MSLISRLLDAVQSWRRGRVGARRPDQRAGVSVEHLDHRQLLSVNFTGNVATDFPATTSPGVVVLPDTASVQHPVISDPALQSLVKVSGFDVSGLRVTYTAADDTLSVGIEQPLSQQPSHPGPVIAGDADNNGNDGTVNPAVAALEPGFQDSPDFGGSEFMGIFLDLKGQNYADVSAGYAVNDPRSPKEFQVARSVANSSPTATSLDFGNGQVQQPGTVFTEVPTSEGNVYKVNSPAHPNLEFSITHFSQLYLQETGTALTPTSVIGMGATAGSGDDLGIGEAFFPEQKFTLAQATLPPNANCPPASPPVIINPHENQHINTAHPTLIRANVLGSSGFDVSQIDPSTVTLGGAHPIFSFDRYINKDNSPDATFIFRGTDVNLPAGYTEATLSGKLTDGQPFSSSVRVFNRDSSYYPAVGVAAAEARQAARAADGILLAPNSPVAINGTSIHLKKRAFAPGSPNAKLVASTLQVDYTTAPVVTSQAAPVVKISSQAVVKPKVSATLNRNLDQFARASVATKAATASPAKAAKKTSTNLLTQVENATTSVWDQALKAVGVAKKTPKTAPRAAVGVATPKVVPVSTATATPATTSAVAGGAE